MDSNLFRKLAFRALRLAELVDDADEAAKLRLAAADYLEKAGAAGATFQQQQQQQVQDDKPHRTNERGRST
jgi:hypothetical protein